MTHPFVRLKRCLTSYIAGFMVLSWSALNPCTCLIFSRIHRKKALENYHQSSIDQSASGRGRWYQEPITRSLHTKCNLESTLSRMFLFLELRYVGGGVFNFPRKHADVRIIEILLCGLYVTQTMEDNSSLMIGYYANTREKTPWVVLLKIKRYGTGLTQRLRMENGSWG